MELLDKRIEDLTHEAEIDHLHASKNILIKLLIAVTSLLDAVIASLNVLQLMGFWLDYILKLTYSSLLWTNYKIFSNIIWKSVPFRIE